ncbi:hypothetical protein GOEFS_015_00340 [Gordonia effusa NBRC 100432]|uniref:Uncharacterized protein n=1 Tax=Gordonia effusa NBRC 100432 TaxID=1077974 RepID=H0QVG0_9ACTN|nr:hypothetical protein GOEFS_015_00340 [Gordonia effusa NBRC 100432]
MVGAASVDLTSTVCAEAEAAVGHFLDLFRGSVVEARPESVRAAEWGHTGSRCLPVAVVGRTAVLAAPAAGHRAWLTMPVEVGRRLAGHPARGAGAAVEARAGSARAVGSAASAGQS